MKFRNVWMLLLSILSISLQACADQKASYQFTNNPSGPSPFGSPFKPSIPNPTTPERIDPSPNIPQPSEPTPIHPFVVQPNPTSNPGAGNPPPKVEPINPVPGGHYNLQGSLVCPKYIENDKYAPYGLALISQFSQNELPLLWAGANDFNKICPEYGDFDQKNRINIWIYLLSQMSLYENSCSETIENPNATNGIAKGLFQLHKNQEQIYAKNCKRGDSGIGDRSVICTLSMLEGQMERHEPLFSNNSYWAVLRPNIFARENARRIANHQTTYKTDAAKMIQQAFSQMCLKMSMASGLPKRR
jgi:hypothetical protein